jgi:hypothetical protein
MICWIALRTTPAHLFCGHIHLDHFRPSARRGFRVQSTCHQAPLDLIRPDSTLSIAEPAAYGLLLLVEGRRDSQRRHRAESTLFGLRRSPVLREQ